MYHIRYRRSEGQYKTKAQASDAQTCEKSEDLRPREGRRQMMKKMMIDSSSQMTRVWLVMLNLCEAQVPWIQL